MVVFTKANATVPNSSLARILSSRELIAALAREFVAGQVEGHIEMMSDFPSEYQTFLIADGCIQGAKESVGDYIEDLLAEFSQSLLAEVENVVIETKSVQIDNDGFIDADVSVTSKL